MTGGRGDAAAHAVLDRAHRQSWPGMLASVIATARDFDLAEDALQHAFVVAASRWPEDGIPERPEGWLVTAARRRAIDVQRRETTLARKAPLLLVDREQAAGESAADPDAPAILQDEELRLIFTCCHPALAAESRLALILRFACGLETPDVARLLLVQESAMAARLTRTRKKLREAGISFRVPAGDDLDRRLPVVLHALYLLFTEGLLPHRGDSAVRSDVLARAGTLVSLIARTFPQYPEAVGLHALCLLSMARLPSRVGQGGAVIPLERQDRTRWDRTAIVEGCRLTRQALVASGPTPGRFTLEAAIAALHADAASMETTDWPMVVAIYNVLAKVAPSPTVALARAMAIGERDGPAAGLAAVDAVASGNGGDHRVFAARARFLERLGQHGQARDAARRAHALASNERERQFLEDRVRELEQADLLGHGMP